MLKGCHGNICPHYNESYANTLTLACCTCREPIASGGLHPATSHAYCDTRTNAYAGSDTDGPTHACTHINANSHTYLHTDTFTNIYPYSDPESYRHSLACVQANATGR